MRENEDRVDNYIARQYDNSPESPKNKEFREAVMAALIMIAIIDQVQLREKKAKDKEKAKASDKHHSTITSHHEPLPQPELVDPAKALEELIKKLTKLAMDFNYNLIQTMSNIAQGITTVTTNAVQQGLLTSQAGQNFQKRAKQILNPNNYTLSPAQVTSSITKAATSPRSLKPTLRKMLQDDDMSDIDRLFHALIMDKFSVIEIDCNNPKSCDKAVALLIIKAIAREFQNAIRKSEKPISSKHTEFLDEMAKMIAKFDLFSRLFAQLKQANQSSGQPVDDETLASAVIESFATCALKSVYTMVSKNWHRDDDVEYQSPTAEAPPGEKQSGESHGEKAPPPGENQPDESMVKASQGDDKEGESRTTKAPPIKKEADDSYESPSFGCS